MSYCSCACCFCYVFPVVVVVVVVVFFFKQKTAYEMRISDWSSDVCSSDLGLKQLGDAGIGDGSFAKILFNAPGFALAYAWHKSDFPLPLHSHDSEIGRASCRERVCQYV